MSNNLTSSPIFISSTGGKRLMEKYWRVKILSLPYSLRATVKSLLKIFRRAVSPRAEMCKCMFQSFLSTIARVANYRCLFTRLLVDYDIPKQIMSSGSKLRETWDRGADELQQRRRTWNSGSRYSRGGSTFLFHDAVLRDAARILDK